MIKESVCQAMLTDTKDNGCLTVRPKHSGCKKKHTPTRTGVLEVSVKFRVRRCVVEPVVPVFIWNGRAVVIEPLVTGNCSVTDRVTCTIKTAL